jgi:outer membrane protein assembly factor BamB
MRHDGTMQDEPPRASDPSPLAPVTELARQHGPRAARIAGIGLLVVVLLAGTGALIRSLNTTGTEPITPTNVDHLVPVWTSSTASGPLAGAVVKDGTLFVGGADGLLAFRSPCTPADKTCRPLWHDRVAGGPLSAPAANGGVVYTGSAHGRVYAFPATCGVVGCLPLWKGNAGKGPVSSPGFNDDFVYVTSNKLYAFPAQCRSDDRACPPAWTGSIPGRAAVGPPAVGGGLVVVASSSPEGGIVAFPAVCVDLCQPIWRGDTGGPTSGVALSADTAYVVARGRLMAFPTSCTGSCEPAWVGPLPVADAGTHTGSTTAVPVPPVAAPAYEGDRVAVGSPQGQLWIFPAGCEEATCPPLRHYDLGEEPLQTPVIDQNVVVVTSSDGVISAIADGCEGKDCAIPWSQRLGAGVAGPPALADNAVYVGDDLGIVHAYVVTGR